jgi:hypothetical protein
MASSGHILNEITPDHVAQALDLNLEIRAPSAPQAAAGGADQPLDFPRLADVVLNRPAQISHNLELRRPHGQLRHTGFGA